MWYLSLALIVSAASALPLAASDFEWLGRVNPDTKELTWPGTGIAFAFTGTEATINFSQVTGDNSLSIAIDDASPIVLTSVNSTTVSTGTLAQGSHTVRVHKRSEAYFGSLFVDGVTTSGTLGTYTPAARRIEYIGDSITVGYGEDGTYPCTNTAAVEDAPNTYGALTAGNLSAEYSLIAWSGKGLTRNYASDPPDTTPVMPVLWTRYGAQDADGSYTFPAADTPQAVVINLGTNDYSYQGVRDPVDQQTFTAAYVDFIQTVTTHYPQAELFLCSSPMLSDTYPTAEDAQHSNQTEAIKNAIAQSNSTKLHFVDFPTQPGTQDTIGCDYHPALPEHEAMAAILIPAIQDALGW